MTADMQIIEAEIGNQPPGHIPAGRRGLPDDLLREAAHRLGILCLVIAALLAVEFFLVHVVYRIPGALEDYELAILEQWKPVFNLVGMALILGSAGLYWYTRDRWRDPRLLLDLALGYEVFLALSAGLLDYAVRPPEGVSGIAIIILLFAAIVPSTPRKTLTVALVAASMDPAGALIWKALGRDIGGMGHVLQLAIPNYLCAVVAVVISHIITRLGREVRKAREMGSYVLGERIGSGGMGEVWRATHRFLARPAAIKLIKPEMLGAVTKQQADVLVQRFRREARAAANLRSPHTIQLYDFGVTSDGTFYYVMELLNGLDLQALVERHGPLPPARTIHLLQQACESLAEAHDRELVHRDIKPANIQVSRMGQSFDYVKVLDFGLVKSLERGAEPEPGLTAPNVVSGTPAYLSPESILGEAVDHRSDIYSLGCVAYWMLTGRQVFEADSVLQLLTRHLQAVPDPPSLHSGFPLPPALEALVLACLAKRPADRPAGAWQMADCLAQVEVDSPWTREDARLWWDRQLEPEAAVTFAD